MTCSYCGANLPNGTIFCTACGSIVDYSLAYSSSGNSEEKDSSTTMPNESGTAAQEIIAETLDTESLKNVDYLQEGTESDETDTSTNSDDYWREYAESDEADTVADDADYLPECANSDEVNSAVNSGNCLQEHSENAVTESIEESGGKSSTGQIFIILSSVALIVFVAAFLIRPEIWHGKREFSSDIKNMQVFEDINATWGQVVGKYIPNARWATVCQINGDYYVDVEGTVKGDDKHIEMRFGVKDCGNGKYNIDVLPNKMTFADGKAVSADFIGNYIYGLFILYDYGYDSTLGLTDSLQNYLNGEISSNQNTDNVKGLTDIPKVQSTGNISDSTSSVSEKKTSKEVKNTVDYYYKKSELNYYRKVLDCLVDTNNINYDALRELGAEEMGGLCNYRFFISDINRDGYEDLIVEGAAGVHSRGRVFTCSYNGYDYVWSNLDGYYVECIADNGNILTYAPDHDFESDDFENYIAISKINEYGSAVMLYDITEVTDKWGFSSYKNYVNGISTLISYDDYKYILYNCGFYDGMNSLEMHDVSKELLTKVFNEADARAVSINNDSYSYGYSDSSEYVLPGSDSRYIDDWELYGLTEETARIARNEIYARHGRMFDSTDLQNYFNSKSWYYPLYEPSQFSESWLNDYEKANVQLLKDYENGNLESYDSYSYRYSDSYYDGDEYVFTGSDYSYISEWDLYGLTAEKARIARNEIYARHGRKFSSSDLQSYFNSKSWYYPIYEPSEFQESWLNEYEKANVQLLKEYEEAGCPYSYY